MAYGDIHNDSGTVCRARKKPCPLGEYDHSPSVEEYIYHKAKELRVDPSMIQRAVADGAKPAEAVALAKDGMLDELAPVPSSEPRKGGYDASEGRFRFRKGMSPRDLELATRDLSFRFDARIREGRSMAPIRLKLADVHGGGHGVPSISYDPLTEKFSVGRSKYQAYTPAHETFYLRSAVDRAAELYGYEDSEYELVDFDED